MLSGIGGNSARSAKKIVPTLLLWGANFNGRLGLGDTITRSKPVQIDRGMAWSSVSAGSHTMAIKSTGSLWAWGYNGTSNYYGIIGGQLGLGDITARSSPVQVGTDTDWSSVSVGQLHTLAIRTAGSLWAWGYNGSGQLGLSDITNRSSPVQIGTDTNWSSVSAGYRHTLARKTDGSLWSWGRRSVGQGGVNIIAATSSPIQIQTATNWKSPSRGTLHNAALKISITQNPTT